MQYDETKKKGANEQTAMAESTENIL